MTKNQSTFEVEILARNVGIDGSYTSPKPPLCRSAGFLFSLCRCVERVCYGCVAARHRQEEAQVRNKLKTSPSTRISWSRDTSRTLTRVSKVNVWAMSSLLGVW